MSSETYHSPAGILCRKPAPKAPPGNGGIFMVGKFGADKLKNFVQTLQVASDDELATQTVETLKEAAQRHGDKLSALKLGTPNQRKAMVLALNRFATKSGKVGPIFLLDDRRNVTVWSSGKVEVS